MKRVFQHHQTKAHLLSLLPHPSFPLLLSPPLSKRLKATIASAHPSSSAQTHVPKIDMPSSIMESIPGPPCYPLIMALPSFQKSGGAKKFHIFFEDLKREYGWVSKVQIPFLNAPVLFHPDDIRLVYASDGKYPAPATDTTPIQKEFYIRSKTEATNLSTAENEEWRRIRNALQKHILPPKVAASYLPLLNPVSRDLSLQLPKFQDDLKDIISRFTFEGVSSVLFGRRLGAVTLDTTPEDGLYIKYALEYFPQMIELSLSPIWRFWKTPGYRKFLRRQTFLNDRGHYYVKELSQKIQEDPDTYSRAFLARMLASKELTLEEVAINVAGLFIAGVDTTSSTLIWLLINLASNPEAQEKLYQELSSALKGGDYDESLSNHLPYTRACFRESNRLSPLAVGIPRRLQKEITVSSGHTFPAGSLVFVAPGTNFRDPRYFERPDDFVPERWLEEAKAKRAAEGNTFADHPMLNIPFSFGARMCIGARFAGVEMNSFITRVVQDYRFELGPNQPPVNKVTRMFTEPEVMPKFRFYPRK